MSNQSKEVRELLGKQVALFRKDRGLTQEELGKLCGITKRSIISIEAGTANTTVDALVKISNALKVVININFSNA